MKLPRAPVEQVIKSLKSSVMLRHEFGFGMEIVVQAEIHGFPHVARALDRLLSWALERNSEMFTHKESLWNETSTLVALFRERIPELESQLDECVSHFESERTRLHAVLETFRGEQAEALRRVARTKRTILRFDWPPLPQGHLVGAMSASPQEPNYAEASEHIFDAVRVALSNFQFPVSALPLMLQADSETASGTPFRPLVVKSLTARATDRRILREIGQSAFALPQSVLQIIFRCSLYPP